MCAKAKQDSGTSWCHDNAWAYITNHRRWIVNMFCLMLCTISVYCILNTSFFLQSCFLQIKGKNNMIMIYVFLPTAQHFLSVPSETVTNHCRKTFICWEEMASIHIRTPNPQRWYTWESMWKTVVSQVHCPQTSYLHVIFNRITLVLSLKYSSWIAS